MVAGVGVQKRTGVIRAKRTPANGGDNTLSTGRQITQPNGTPARKHKPHKPHRRTCKGCGEKFQPTRKGQLHCSTRCRKKIYRANAKKRRKPAAAAEKPLAHSTCRYCGAGFFHDARRAQLYCKASHRVAASVAKRAAGERALVDLIGWEPRRAIECSEKWGSKGLDQFLKLKGFCYFEAERRWDKPKPLEADRQNPALADLSAW